MKKDKKTLIEEIQEICQAKVDGYFTMRPALIDMRHLEIQEIGIQVNGKYKLETVSYFGYLTIIRENGQRGWIMIEQLNEMSLDLIAIFAKFIREKEIKMGQPDFYTRAINPFWFIEEPNEKMDAILNESYEDYFNKTRRSSI